MIVTKTFKMAFDQYVEFERLADEAQKYLGRADDEAVEWWLAAAVRLEEMGLPDQAWNYFGNARIAELANPHSQWGTAIP